MTALKNAATLLDVPVDRLAESLIATNTVIQGEKIRRPYSTAQAYDCRDALSKTLYASLFGWIVSSINEMLAPELHQKRIAGGRPGRAQAAAPAYEIGLGIFFKKNVSRNYFITVFKKIIKLFRGSGYFWIRKLQEQQL